MGDTTLMSAVFYSMVIGLFMALWELYKKKLETAKSLKQEIIILSAVLVIFSIGVRINPWFGSPLFMFMFLKIIQKIDEYRIGTRKPKKYPKLSPEKLNTITKMIQEKMGGWGYGGSEGGEEG